MKSYTHTHTIQILKVTHIHTLFKKLIMSSVTQSEINYAADYVIKTLLHNHLHNQRINYVIDDIIETKIVLLCN